MHVDAGVLALGSPNAKGPHRRFARMNFRFSFRGLSADGMKAFASDGVLARETVRDEAVLTVVIRALSYWLA